MYRHAEPIACFLTPHSLNSLRYRAHRVTIAHGGERPKQKPQPQCDILRELLCFLPLFGGCEPHASRGKELQDPMLNKIKVPAPKPSESARPC
jgi:hypothetical protein